MTKKTATLKVPFHIAEEMTRIVMRPDSGVKKDGVEFDEEVTFDCGARMAIQVCASGNPSEESCWTQGVLFSKEGQELGRTDCGESFLGEYCVEHDGVDFKAFVVVGNPEQKEAADAC